jgi:hypothetical protein
MMRVIYINAVLLLLVCGDDLLSTFSTQYWNNDACCNMRHLVASAQGRNLNNRPASQRNSVPCQYLRGSDPGGVAGARRGNRCTLQAGSVQIQRGATSRVLGRGVRTGVRVR